MSGAFASLLSVDAALTLLQFCTVQDSLRLYSGNNMYRQLFASTRVDVVLLVLWYIDGFSAILHIFLDSCSQGAYFSDFSGDESLHGEDFEEAQELQQMHAVVCASLYHRYMRLVLSRQPLSVGFVSYEVLRYPLSLWSEAQAMSRRGSDSIYFSLLQKDILEGHRMPILRRMGMSRHTPDPTMVFS